MNDPAILFVKPKAISNADKKALRSAGVIIVEIDNPTEVKFVRAGYEIGGSEMLQCAARAISHSEHAEKLFGKIVAAYLSEGGDAK